jgi:glycosyltransferase involved in cell wall biosynthesis
MEVSEGNIYLCQFMAEKIKVLHVIKSLGRGGAEMLLPETIRLHDRERFEFHVIYFLPWKNQLVQTLEQTGACVTCFSANNNIQLLFRAGKIIQYVKRHQISLIHAHLPWAGFVSRLVHGLTKVPLLYTEHNKQERYHFLTRWLNRITFNWQSMAIAVSGDVAESIQKNIQPVVPVKRILNGVNVDLFQRNKEDGAEVRSSLGIDTDAIVVGTVAVFRFQKRLIEWLEIFHKAATHEPKLIGIIVGDGPLKPEIVQRVKEFKLEGRVHLAGLQTEVRPWFSAMDIFMMSSIFEGLPIALLEAMSMACAIATTDAGGIKEVIRHEVDGLMVPVDQWKSLSDLLTTLANDDERRRMLGTAARARVIQTFGMDRMVESLERLYHESLV